MSNESFLPRLRLLSTAIILFVLLIVTKLYFVQIVQGRALSEEADRQYLRPQGGLFDRGSIFFEDKMGTRVSAATLGFGFTLAINPERISDDAGTYEALAALTSIDHDDFFFKAGKKNDPYEEIAHRLSEDVAARIQALNLPGVALYKERWRFYPGGTLGARTVGFVGYNQDNERVGRYGLEQQYEPTLRRDTNSMYVNFFAEVFSNFSSIVLRGRRDTEGDIVTFIEPTVELELEKELRGVVETWHPRSVGGMVIDPTTGAIYALGVLPSFDPNEFQKVRDQGLFPNPLVQSVFEMGSIIKPLTMSAGIDVGAVTAQTTYNDKGFLTLDTKRVSNFDGKGRGVVSMQEVLNQSLNTGAAFVVQKMGKQKFADYFRAYGLGEKTNIDLPGEVVGLVDNLNSPRDVEYATAAFGQGIALTPIATARALSALANGGVLVTPHVAKTIDYTIGITKSVEPEIGQRVISEATSDEITRMLVEAVDTSLLGGTVKNPHYSVAAKTGTAQIADKTNGGYYNDRYFHSFFGYFPAYNPRFLIFLYVEEPEGARYASDTVAMPFIRLVNFLISYYQIPPDR